MAGPQRPRATTARPRVYYLDGLRGWAAFAVLYGHIEFWFENAAKAAGHTLMVDAFNSSPPGLLSWLAVNLFFAVSGFALSYPVLTSPAPYRTLCSMALVRYWRLTLPILAACLLADLLWRADAYWNGPAGALARSPWFAQFYSFRDGPPTLWRFSLWDVYFHYARGHTWNPVLWTMAIEFVGSFGLFAFLACIRRRAFRLAAATAGSLWLARGDYFGFPIGYLAAEFTVSRASDARDVWERLGWFLLASGTVFGCFFISPFVSDGVRGSIGLNLALNIATMLVIGGFALCRRAQRALSGDISLFMGKISFSLYLTHFPLLCSVGSFLYVAAARHGLSFGQCLGVVAATMVPTCLITARVFHAIVEERALFPLKARIGQTVDRLWQRRRDLG